MPKDVINEMRKDIEATHKHRDGIPQIAVGIFLIIAMGQLAMRNSVVMVAFVGFIPMIIEGMRKRITYPRIGYAKFPEPSKLRRITSIMVAMVIALLIIGFMVFKLGDAGSFPAGILRTIVLAVIGIAVLVIGVVLVMRSSQIDFVWEFGIFFAPLVLLAFHQLTLDNLVYVVFGFGLLNLGIGIVRLYRFISKYPVIKDE